MNFPLLYYRYILYKKICNICLNWYGTSYEYEWLFWVGLSIVMYCSNISVRWFGCELTQLEDIQCKSPHLFANIFAIVNLYKIYFFYNSYCICITNYVISGGEILKYWAFFQKYISWKPLELQLWNFVWWFRHLMSVSWWKWWHSHSYFSDSRSFL